MTNMKKLIFVALLTIFSLTQAQVSSRTSIFKLPQWSAGNKLAAGTENDSSVSNDGLNNAFARLDALLSRNIDSQGYIKSIVQGGTGNLNINSGSESGTPTRVVLADSLYGSYNFYFVQNGLIEGNLYVGGYITTDSIVGGQLTLDSINTRAFTSSGDALVEGNLQSYGYIMGGLPTSFAGVLRLYDDGVAGRYADITPLGEFGAAQTLSIDDVSGTIATTNGNQNFTDVAEITADSITVSGKIESGTYIRINESDDSPNGSIKDADMFVYKDGGGDYYFIIKYNDGGTIRYKYMQLNGTSTTWTHATSLP
jgi:hypothetical protein